MRNFLFIFLFAGLLISCDGSTEIEFKIRNNSSTTLTVYQSDTSPQSTLDTNTIPVGSEYVLYSMDLLGGQGNPFNVNDFIDTLIIVNANGDTLQKDFSQMPNWQDQINQTKKFPSIWNHEYVLEVTDADF